MSTMRRKVRPVNANLSNPPSPVYVALTATAYVESGDDLDALVSACLEIVSADTNEDVVIWSGGQAVAVVLSTGAVVPLVKTAAQLRLYQPPRTKSYGC